MFSIRSLIKLRSVRSEITGKLTKRTFFPISYYEPPYLEANKPKYPVYEALTVQVKGYDFPVLENFQRFAHSIAQYLDIKVDLAWANPARHFDVDRYKPRSTVVDAHYHILVYERNIKVMDVPTTKLPIFLEVLQAALPEGTTLKVFPFDPVHEEERYVPDHELIAKSKELEALGGPPTDLGPKPVKVK